MKIIKYLILSIITSITSIFPISYKGHIIFLQNFFNTKIFNYEEINSFMLFGVLIVFIYLIIKEIINKKILKRKKKYLFKFILFIIINYLINIFIYLKFSNISFKKIPWIFIILSILLIFIRNKKSNNKKYNEISIKNLLVIIIINIIGLILNLPIFITTLLGCLLCKIETNTSLIYAILISIPLLIIDSYKGIIYVFKTNDIVYMLISLIIVIIISIFTFNKFKELLINNKLFKISIYLITLALFIMYWFR